MVSFDQDFPREVRDELNRRADHIENKDVQWNYDKYAWVNMRATGNSTTVFKSQEGNQLGDPGIRGPHIELYDTEGGVRRLKPQLKSVKISNQGAQDYADSFIYEIEASFTAYTLDQLNSLDRSYFRVGAEVEFNFGWEGYTNAENRGTVTANVYNFGFSLADDGSFECNIKCMSAAGLWASDDMGGVIKDESGDSDANEDGQADFLKDLQKSFRRSFGLDEDEDADSVDDLGNNKLIYKDYRLTRGSKNPEIKYSTKKIPFFAAELVTKAGFFNDDETYVGYCTIQTLIDYLNFKSDDSIYRYVVAPQDDVLGTWPKIEAIGCADPMKFVLPGAQGSYGDPDDDGWFDGDAPTNFSRWGDVVEEASDSNVSDVGKIIVSLKLLNDVYMDLSKKAGTKSGVKMNPKVSDFIKAVFAELESLTGGLISLNLIPLTNDGQILGPNQVISQDAPITLMLANKKMVSNSDNAKRPTPYEFEILKKRSITRSVSLSSDFDTDLMIAATPKNVAKNTSNLAGLGTYYETEPENLETISKTEADPTADEILKTRLRYGNGGFDDSKIQSYTELCRNFILREARSNEQMKGGRYGEIQFVLNLSVTLDGIWGIPFLAPIKIDRLPELYKKDGVIFTITGVEHTFDGQGDWETSIETVMRMV